MAEKSASKKPPPVLRKTSSRAAPLNAPLLPPRRSSRSSSSPRHVVIDSRPPPVPPTARPFIPGFSKPGSPSRYSRQPLDSQLQGQNEELLDKLLSEEESERLTLSQFVQKYSKFFPLRVKVVKGFYTERVEVAAEEVYNIHFLKRAKVATIMDTYGDKYVIPMNSAIQFGLVYNPADERATFASVADLIAAPTLPNVVLAEKAFRGHDQKSSVDENEVLILQGVHKVVKSRFGLGNMVLKAYSLTKMEDKTLSRTCTGQFTTTPYSTRLHLPEIMKFINNPLQLKARMFWDCDTAEDLPSHLISDLVTISDQTTESSLIATQCDPGENTDDVITSVPDESQLKEVADIPLDLDIEVVVISQPESETEKLYMDTREIYQTFDPSKVKTYKVPQDTPTGEMCVAQSQLYTAVREGYETEGLDLEMPAMAYDPHRKKDQPVAGTAVYELDSDQYETVDYERKTAHSLKKAQSLPERPEPDPTVTSQVNSLKGAFTLLQNQLQSLETTQKKQNAQLTGVRSTLAEANVSALNRIAPLVDGLTKRCDALQEEVQQLKQQIANMSPTSVGSVDPQQEKNKEELATMTQTQVHAGSHHHS